MKTKNISFIVATIVYCSHRLKVDHQNVD